MGDALDFGMVTLFYRRLFGSLALDAGAFEEIERDRGADLQSMLVVLCVCMAGGVGAIGMGVASVMGFMAATLMVLGAWLVWVTAIAAVGVAAMGERETRSNVHELLRVLGFAAAPGLLLAFGAIRPVAPLVAGIAAVWMIAAAVIGVRQALDYRSTVRAVIVCVMAWLLASGALAVMATALGQRVGS